MNSAKPRADGKPVTEINLSPGVAAQSAHRWRPQRWVAPAAAQRLPSPHTCQHHDQGRNPRRTLDPSSRL